MTDKPDIRQFILRDVRCFADEQRLNIRPLTFLVGENSTGKSTILACFHALARFLQSGGNWGKSQAGFFFNESPYQMGVFADIVRKSRPQKESFALGFRMPFSKKETVDCVYEFGASAGGEAECKIARYSFSAGGHISFTLFADDRKLKIDQTADDKFDLQGPVGLGIDLGYIWDIANLRNGERQESESSKALREFLTAKFKPIINLPPQLFTRIMLEIQSPLPRIKNFAPIRSRPRRTYNPGESLHGDPEGGDIPLLLRNMDQKRLENLRRALNAFGKASGMFSDVRVRKLGKAKNEPFQVRIKVRGPSVNMVDVGYGVSQILPVLVGILDSPDPACFAMQQPEVHLHPRAQAELTSLMVELYQVKGHHFLLETHSDFMLDRAVIEIRRGRIAPEDVSLIYLEPKGNMVKAHNITFDNLGNMQGVPKGYRDFFLKEADAFLGFGDE